MIAFLLAAARAAQAPLPAPLTIAPLTVAGARQSLVGQWQANWNIAGGADKCFD